MKKQASKAFINKRAGVTLLEVLIASAIIVIFCSGFFLALITSLKSQWLASTHYRAMNLAKNRIQHARTVDFGTLPLMAEDSVKIDEEGNLSITGQYIRTTTVNTNIVPGLLYEITVQIKCPGINGKTNTTPLQLSTMIAKGMQ
jgi:prepilin-type N-terminal cleavage/methylation domain-containing protein